MAIKTKDEIMKSISERLGENPDDGGIALLEDITDTITDLESKANGDGTDWKSKYEENDAEWRKKYTERFYSPAPDSEPVPGRETRENANSPKTFAELFKTE